MVKLQAVIIVAIFTVLYIGINGEEKARNKRDTIEIVSNVNLLQWLCQNNPWGLYFSWCAATTTTAPPQTTSTQKPSTAANAGATSSSSSSTASPASTTSTTTSAPTALQSAHWCRFSNGTYITLGQTFMQMPCVICQCAQNHNILCATLQCMPTACIDNSTPQVKPGNCCPTCSYETQAMPCTQGGVTFPHGTIIKTVNNNGICWCQTGTIECRQTVVTTVYSSMDYFGNGTTVYIVIIVICLIFMLGTLLCCGCGLLYYYYYQNQQQAVQQAYEQYYNNAGWQPMGEEGQVDDAAAKEKEAEGGQNQFEHQYPTGHSAEFIPPPYAVYNGPYGSEEHGKEQRHV
jgi:hypothetical protein